MTKTERRRWNFDRVFPVVIIAACLSVAGGVGWLIYSDVDDYRRQCHRAGGHIVEVKDEEICVDHDGKVIFI
jgi:hypothetical protein